MQNTHYQVLFMPWAGLRGEIEIGPITIWPFSDRAKASEHVGEEIRKYLERYFRCYVDHDGQPLNRVTVCSHGPCDFRVLTSEEARDVRAAVDALIFSIICPAIKSAVFANNQSMGPPSADRYQLLTQNFRPDSDYLAVQAGTLLSGGLKIGEASFQKPWSMGGAFARPDPEFLDGFSRLYDAGFSQELREQFWRSLEWFRMAHVESEEVSRLSKVLMMAIIFEIMLEVSRTSNKSKKVADEIESLCVVDGSLKETRKIGNKDVQRSKIGWWAWDFYKLRNAIVHGDSISTEQWKQQSPMVDWLDQLIAADLVLWEVLSRKMFDLKLIGARIRSFSQEFAAGRNNPESLYASVLPSSLGYGYTPIHRALGWLPE